MPSVSRLPMGQRQRPSLPSMQSNLLLLGRLWLLRHHADRSYPSRPALIHYLHDTVVDETAVGFEKDCFVITCGVDRGQPGGEFFLRNGLAIQQQRTICQHGEDKL